MTSIPDIFLLLISRLYLRFGRQSRSQFKVYNRSQEIEQI